MGVRTLFNILGPLTNPAGAPNILMGVFHPDLVGIQVRVLQRLGARNALVVWGRDGMDEISLGAATLVGELRDGAVREYEVASGGVRPRDGGQPRAARRRCRRVARDACSRRSTTAPALARDIVALNAGAALYAAGRRRIDRRRTSGAPKTRSQAARRAPSSTSSSATTRRLKRSLAMSGSGFAKLPRRRTTR